MSTATAIGPGGAFAARTAIFIKSTSYPSSQYPQKTTFQGLSIHDAKRGVSTSFVASGDKTAVSVKRGRGLAFEIKARKTAGASKEIELRGHLNEDGFLGLPQFILFVFLWSVHAGYLLCNIYQHFHFRIMMVSENMRYQQINQKCISYLFFEDAVKIHPIAACVSYKSFEEQICWKVFEWIS
ncbi:hypothetical protein LXL04_014382 [Taraxacum kok-saghyz]